MENRYTAVDLFSGCGGLTLGIEAAGFDLRVAVENDPVAAETYRQNYPRTILIEKDICRVNPEEIKKALNGRKISLLVGCTPCQGFCSLTRKWRVEDPRNGLLLEMARLIRELVPNAVMMENVPGLASHGIEVFESFLRQLDSQGYYSQYRIVQMADYGVPQSRRRLVMLAGRGFVIPFPQPTHARQPEIDSSFKRWVSLRDAIGNMLDPITFSEAKRNGGPRKFNWHVVRDIQPQTKARLQAAVPGETWLKISERLRPNCHKGGYKGFTNVYGRMTWDQVAVTITGGSTTACKGRFGHPEPKRTTISVREAALIQTFPKSYKFATDQMDAVCEMIGNAVPPLFAKITGRQIKKSLDAHYGALARAS